jgi:hypothetical protein
MEERIHPKKKKHALLRKTGKFTVAALLIFGIVVGGYIAAMRIFPYMGWKTMTSEDLGYTVSYPAKWHAYDAGSYLSPFSRTAFKDRFPVSLNFWVLGTGHYAGDDAFVHAVAEELAHIEKANPGVHVLIERSETELPIMRATITRFANRVLPPKHEYDNIGDIEGEQVIYWVSRGDETLRFDHLYPIAEREYYTDLFDKLLSSLSVDLVYSDSTVSPYKAFVAPEAGPSEYFLLTPATGFLAPDLESIPLEFISLSDVVTSDAYEYEYIHSKTGGMLKIYEDIRIDYFDTIRPYSQLEPSYGVPAQVMKRDIEIQGYPGMMVMWMDAADAVGDAPIAGLSVFLNRDGHTFGLELDATGMDLRDPFSFVRMIETFREVR